MLPIRSALLATTILAFPVTGTADTVGIPKDAVARIEVLPGWQTAAGTHMAALKITLAPGWKTYWRAPGDAGIPPRFNWEGSRNLSAVRFHWPRPEVYTINGMRSIGYYGELVLPMELSPRHPDEAIGVEAEIELGVCRDICIPMTAHVTADLAVGGQLDQRISNALAAQPKQARDSGVSAVECDVEPIRDGLRLTARIEMPRIGPEEVAVFELPDQAIWVSDSESHRDGSSLVAASDLVPPSGGPFLLDRSMVRITVLGEGSAVEVWGCPSG